MGTLTLRSLALGGLVLVALVVGCGDDEPPLSVQVTHSPATEDQPEKVHIAVKARPGSRVELTDHKDQSHTVELDEQGRGTTTLEWSADDRREVTFTVKMFSREGPQTEVVRYTLPQPPPALLNLGTREARMLSCMYGPHCTVHWLYPRNRFEITGDEGVMVQIGGEQVTVGGSGNAQLEPNEIQLLAGVPMGQVFGTGDEPEDLGVTARVTPPGGAETQGLFQLVRQEAQHMVARALRGVSDGGVAVAPDGQGSAVLVVFGGDDTTDPAAVEVIGSPEGLGDFRYVALVELAIRSVGCGAYGSPGNTFQVTATAESHIFRLYDRRSGEQRGERRFNAPAARCPDDVYGPGASPTTRPDADAERAWIQSQISG